MWPEFRVDYDELATQYEAMKRQRARGHVLQEQILHIAKEAKLELAKFKRAEAMSYFSHSEELKVVKQERDDSLVNASPAFIGPQSSPQLLLSSIAVSCDFNLMPRGLIGFLKKTEIVERQHGLILAPLF